LADQSGSLMMIYSNDPLVSINTLKKTIRKIKGFNFQNSIIENKVLSVKSIEALSKYPDKNTLLSVTLSYIKIGTFQLIDVLEQIKDKKS
jgi:ribosomal protein L10